MSSAQDYPLNLDHIPDVDFAVKDPVLVEQEIITDWEAKFFELTQIPKTLAPGDPVRMHLQNIAHTCDQLRVLIDFAAKENLIKYSQGAYLDNLAALYGPRADRLPAVPATTTLQFTLVGTVSFDVIIPIGTQAQASNQITFQTTAEAIIPRGTLSVTAPAECMTPGLVGNGYLPGQISDLVGWNQPYQLTVTNTTESVNGAEIETDSAYRYRTWLTPESFSTCGPKQAYEYWALRAHQSIIQAVIYSAPDIAGEVHIYPLCEDGTLPDQSILDLVLSSCSANTRRPVTDYVSAYVATAVYYDVNFTWYARQADQLLIDQINTKVIQAVDDWMLWTKSAIGRDVIPDNLTKRLIDAGAKRVVYTAPVFYAAAYNELAMITTGTTPVITFGGYEDE
jgi:phage-related baseplate assembly protein